MVVITPTVHQVYEVVTIATYVVTCASAIVNLPFMKKWAKADGALSKVSRILNFLALNLAKVDKK